MDSGARPECFPRGFPPQMLGVAVDDPRANAGCHEFAQRNICSPGLQKQNDLITFTCWFMHSLQEVVDFAGHCDECS